MIITNLKKILILVGKSENVVVCLSGFFVMILFVPISLYLFITSTTACCVDWDSTRYIREVKVPLSGFCGGLALIGGAFGFFNLAPALKYVSKHLEENFK